MTTNGTKEHPILFSGPMVRAILEGRKTQTRRVIKPQPIRSGPTLLQEIWPWGVFSDDPDRVHLRTPSSDNPCPFGKPGDRLWVRETWRRADGLTTYYKADEPENVGAGWKSPIHMPYRFSRLKLEIVNIRVEQLQEISELDAKAEGVLCYGDSDPASTDYKNYEYNDKYGDDWGVATARESYQSAWQTINAKRGYPWESNPLVWVIHFAAAQQLETQP